MFLLIDNYDSFTFNLVQAFYKAGLNPEVRKNDDFELLSLATDDRLSMVCISPGPSHPVNAGQCLQFLDLLPKHIPVLGVCLGHQVLGAYAGATVEVGPRIMHGKSSLVMHDGSELFAGLPAPMTVGRYHSLTVRAEEKPDLLEITATSDPLTDDGTVMAMRYRDRPWMGVQFHPESVLTPEGETLLANFCRMATAQAGLQSA
ncbi:anthranilate synthase component II [Oleidesulfovibrio sp.]|uniref:anthranilate synthase component II n=1 Tax=Oleidesulfovibrio sp. TaxID=2909707 RepID=UPI003A87C043